MDGATLHLDSDERCRLSADRPVDYRDDADLADLIAAASSASALRSFAILDILQLDGHKNETTITARDSESERFVMALFPGIPLH